jgi:hypothetical protein
MAHLTKVAEARADTADTADAASDDESMDSDSEADIYIAEKIVDMRRNENCRAEYRVRWQGYALEDDT